MGEPLSEELEAEIVERRAVAAERQDALAKKLAKLSDERQKLLSAFYANAIPLALPKDEQDRISGQERAAKQELEVAESDLDGGWQDVLRTAIKLAGNCHAPYLKARPSVRRRFIRRCSRSSTSRTGRSPERSSPRFSRPSSRARVRIGR